MSAPKPVVLCILDGWGYREETDHNAIAAAHTPNWDRLWQTYPHSLLEASEQHVGLPGGQMGNSEVGHMHIGAGRRLLQDLPRIDAAIENGSLAQNPRLLAYIQELKAAGGDCHLMGLLSDGGVHAHQRHILALAHILAEAGVKVWLHVFLDGRDTPPKSAAHYVSSMLKAIAGQTNIHLATLCGRYYAMDRDKRWDRVGKAYRLLVDAEGECITDPVAALEAAYANGQTDEFIEPLRLHDFRGMKGGDGLLMAHFRADRARQILTALLDPAFDGFARARIVRFSAALGMVEYSDALSPLLPALFPPETVANGLGETVSAAGLKQLRLAETEKYAHVTFFMNGGREQPFAGEERLLIASPDVATYDLQPEMSAPELTDRLAEAIHAGEHALIIVNYANPDMVGHSGQFDAAVKAVEAIDVALGQLSEAVLEAGGALLITADHGNVEQMSDPNSGQTHTAHTLNPVPALLVSHAYQQAQGALRNGTLTDIAPTLLALLGLAIPNRMTGTCLLSDIRP